jgi:large subunit ribosomal protein L35
MPKLKTHKGAQKRFTVNGSGVLRQPKSMKSHFRRRRSSRVKQQLDKLLVTDPSVAKRIKKKILPYGT